jgi:hypothetical protein
MTTSTTHQSARSRFRFLDPDQDFAEEVPLERFPVLLPEFKPVEDESPLDDGEPPTKLGQRFRKAFADANGIAEAEVPHGLIRDVEALSADHDSNIKSLAQPYITRNHAGEQVMVRLKVHTFLAGPALANGRMMSRVGRQLEGRARVITNGGEEHEVFRMPRLNLDSAKQAPAVTTAQRQIEDLRAYGATDQNFLDSIALEGIIQAPVVAPFHITTIGGEEGFLTQSEDGWRRLTGSRELCSELLGVSTDLTYRHWENPDDGTLTVRSHSADSIRRTLSMLRFKSSEKSRLLYPSSRNAASVRTWLTDVADNTAFVRAFHRMRTVDVEFVIAMRPLPGNTAFDVFYLDMAGRHVPGRAPKEWNEADVRGVVAVKIIDALVEADLATSEERAAWLGENSVPTQDDVTATPFRNRLVAGISLLAAVTTNGDPDRRSIVRDALRDHGRPNSPTESATIAAAQTAVVFEVDGTAAMGQVSAALAATFKHASLYKTDAHDGSWTDLISTDPATVHAAAVAELGETHNHTDRLVGDLGPHQRVMMALTAVAHMTNPALISRDDQMTRTGRGGRGLSGPNAKSDPPTLLQAMVKNVDGLRRCLAIIEAAIEATPTVPLDPASQDTELTEEFLRREYLGSEPEEEDGHDDQPDELDAESQWWNDIDHLRAGAERLRDSTEAMRSRPMPPDLSGATTPGDSDDSDDSDDEQHSEFDDEAAPRMAETYGVKPTDAEAIKAALDSVTDFVLTGRAVYSLRRRA